MSQVIIYQTAKGIAVVHPATCGLSVAEIARKDVPAGVAYKIVSDADIPTDRTFRAALAADFSEPDGYGIGPEAWSAAHAAKEETR